MKNITPLKSKQTRNNTLRNIIRFKLELNITHQSYNQSNNTKI